jgi:hypothetical protein
MKRIFFYVAAIIISSATFLTSCTEEEDPVNLPPSISFLAGDTLISSNSTVTVDETFHVGVNAVANVTSQSKIQSIRVTRIFNNQTVGDNTFPYNDEAVTVIIEFEALPEIGTENIEFTVTDKDGQSAKKSLQITTEEAESDINAWEMRILGSWDNDTGSSFASVDGIVYKLNEAFINQSKIDFMYWWGQSTSATIGSPNDENADDVFNTGQYALDNWDTLNDTKFKTTSVTATDFDAIQTAAECISLANGANQTRIGGLVKDQVIAFITVTGKHGLIRANSIVTGSAGSITIDVKVEK